MTYEKFYNKLLGTWRIQSFDGQEYKHEVVGLNKAQADDILRVIDELAGIIVDLSNV